METGRNLFRQTLRMGLFLILFFMQVSMVQAQAYKFNYLNSSLRKVLALYVADKDGIYQKSDVSEVKELFGIATYYAYDKKEKKLYVKTSTGNYEVSLDDYLAKDFKKNKAIPQPKPAEIAELVERVNLELADEFAKKNAVRRQEIEVARIKAYNDSVAAAKEAARKLAERQAQLKAEREKYIKENSWRKIPTGGKSLFCAICEKTFNDDPTFSMGVKDDSIYFVTKKDGDLDLTYSEVHVAKVPDDLKAYSPYQYHYEVFADSLESGKLPLCKDFAGYMDYQCFQDYLTSLRKKAPYGYFDGWSWDDEYGTVTFKCTYQNTNKLTIKYIDVYWVVTNDVNDVRGSGHFKGTGPVEYMHSGSWDWNHSYYFVGGDATNMRITKLIITYMNGTQKVLNRNMLRFNSSDED